MRRGSLHPDAVYAHPSGMAETVTVPNRSALFLPYRSSGYRGRFLSGLPLPSDLCIAGCGTTATKRRRTASRPSHAKHRALRSRKYAHAPSGQSTAYPYAQIQHLMCQWSQTHGHPQQRLCRPLPLHYHLRRRPRSCPLQGRSRLRPAQSRDR